MEESKDDKDPIYKQTQQNIVELQKKLHDLSKRK